MQNQYDVATRARDKKACVRMFVSVEGVFRVVHRKEIRITSRWGAGGWDRVRRDPPTPHRLQDAVLPLQ